MEEMMRMILQVNIPHDKFNVAVKDGTAGAKMKKILDDTKPEAVYFTEYNGQRGAILIIDIKDASQIPFYTEPWFLTFNADCHFHIVISPEDLGKAGLEALGKKWA
jgi:hypothetical protein